MVFHSFFAFDECALIPNTLVLLVSEFIPISLILISIDKTRFSSCPHCCCKKWLGCINRTGNTQRW
ncbi:hypothetical protein CEQ48_01910 [Vibrio tarriae]|uniref:Uncharacterized protein n=1 Tax=Vibrio tarriae TaxID=2014742 RepID=A0AAU8W9C6_9VIBR|nr:hypothetical protein CEQ48_01910 [Vibrio tarriae]